MPVNHDVVSVSEILKDLTGGRGPDACVDAVGMESHGSNLIEDIYDRAKQKLDDGGRSLGGRAADDHLLPQGGTVVVMGVYAGFVDKFPLGIAMNKALKFRMGQMYGQKYIPRLFEHFKKGEVDPSFVFSHRLPLDEAPRAYRMFRDKEDQCLKILLTV